MIQPDRRTWPAGVRARLNPYRIGLRLLLDRVCWDLSPVSWVHRKKLRMLRNAHVEEKAIILCNGPSLNDVDFSAIGSVFTFGLNKINLLFRQTAFRPSAIVSVNPYVIEQNIDFFSSTDIPLFLDHRASRYDLSSKAHVHFLHSCGYPCFARNCSLSLFQGYTVTYVALQLAYHMGFRKVALVGCDHDFKMTGNPNAITYNESKDPGHFCEDYFSPGQPWQFPDLKGSEHYYALARCCYNDDGRVIVNASAKSRLDVFPLMRLEEFIHDG
jgi:hypothetical protein